MAVLITLARFLQSSGSAPVVVLQHATKPFMAFDFSGNDFSILAWLDELITKSLMIPFCMVVLDLFTHGVLQ